MKRMLKGFTLVEIMIVVAIIAILAAVAIPNFIRYRKTSMMNACISNLKQIQAACEQCKMEGKEVNNSNVIGADKYIKVMPKCPATKASYTLPTGDANPECPNPETSGADFKHVLPEDAAASGGAGNG